MGVDEVGRNNNHVKELIILQTYLPAVEVLDILQLDFDCSLSLEDTKVNSNFCFDWGIVTIETYRNW